MKKIITITLNTAIDCVISKDEYSRNKNAVDITEYATALPAGKGINVSRALSCENVDSLALGFVGIEDKPLFDGVSGEHIKTDFIFVPGNTRRNITVTGCNDGMEHHIRNAGFSVTEEHISLLCEKLDFLLAEESVVILSGSLPTGAPIDTYKRLIERIKKHGSVAILDTGGEALFYGMCASPYLIKPNLEELSSLSNSPLNSDEKMRAFIRKLSSDNNISYVLTTLSQDGALLYNLNTDTFLSSPAYTGNDTSRQIVSSVGCGDTSLAAFLSAHLRGLSDEEALRLSMKRAYYNLFTETPGMC